MRSFSPIYCFLFSYVSGLLLHKAGLLFLLPILLLLLSRQKKLQSLALCCLAVCLGSANYELTDPLKNPKHYILAGTESYTLLEVCEEPEERARTFRAKAMVLACGKDSILEERCGYVQCYFTKDAPLPHYGDHILTWADWRPIEGFTGRDGKYFDYAGFMANKGIYAQLFLSAQNFSLKEHKLSPWQNFKRGTNSLRARLRLFWESCGMNSSESAVAKALILGERGSDPIEEAYRKSGIIHVLAVSGMHLSIFACMAAATLSFLGKKRWQRWLRFLLVLMPVWGYAVLTGMSPSVCRAAYMFTVVGLGDCLKRKVNTVRSLAISALLLLLIKPALLYDTGFLLSYTAVVGLTLLNPLISGLWNPKNKILRFFKDLSAASLAAQLATLPIILCVFGNFPTYFLIGNCLVAPLVNIALPLGIAISVLSLLWSTAAGVLASYLMDMLLQIMNLGAQTIERLPAAVAHFSISLPAAILLCAVVITGYMAAKKRSAPLIRRSLSLLLAFLWLG
ncbi:MAG: ComEC/Rec2 family competence protein [Lentimicrobiaceae bacterium]|nr:ComEC/Rec2 family competence protein [Lentimicrobiaceae bacterium]